MKQRLQNKQKKWVNRGVCSPITDIQALQRDYIIEIRQTCHFLWQLVPLVQQRCFHFLDGSPRGVASCNCPPQSVPDLFCRVENWLANRSDKYSHSLEIRRPEELCGLALSSIKMNSGPTPPLKRRT
ncbi:hypothetical protein AVEN_206076-1 [Araneus ventricosus]|uniref:Uncharacterized protein n=1 Tax=Araneus ventricosus TaxID=182803 RepID=A0A4Y2UI61_ARAVE|nr:hypothetical protein AVEN_206076-1 [Araneus ventricosus]